jgi:hypothetical protein
MTVADRCHSDVRIRSQRPESVRGLADHHMTFGDARLPEEYHDILSIRLRAHQRAGHFAGFNAADLGSSFDAHSRHLLEE